MLKWGREGGGKSSVLEESIVFEDELVEREEYPCNAFLALDQNGVKYFEIRQSNGRTPAE